LVPVLEPYDPLKTACIAAIVCGPYVMEFEKNMDLDFNFLKILEF
jgi:hypothetical protein